MMQVSKKIPFDDPQVLLGVRILYVVSNLVIIGLYLYITRQINYKKGKSTTTPVGILTGLHKRCWLLADLICYYL
jgi:hypothetical protein